MTKATKHTHGRFTTAVAIALLGVTMTTATTGAHAAGEWYARAAAGLVFVSDDDSATFTAPAVNSGSGQNADSSFDAGTGVGGALGRWFSDRWRGDVEFMYRSNDVDSAMLADGSMADGDNYASTTLSVNGYYHFSDPGEIGAFSPYAGAGIAWFSEIDIDLTGADLAGAPYEDLEDDGVGFQIMGGVSWRQSERLRFEAELRWTSFGDADLNGNDGVTLTGVDYDPLTLAVGVSYRF